jgi:hypothetical protein
MRTLLLLFLLAPTLLFGQIFPENSGGGGGGSVTVSSTNGALAIWSNTVNVGTATNLNFISANSGLLLTNSSGLISIALNPNLTTIAASGISTTNIVWVSKAGNDATGARCRLDLPFQSLTAAKNAALAGDTVYILPGSYHATNLFKNGVNWYGGSGVLLSNLSDNPGGIFDNSALGTSGAITSSIYGDMDLLVIHQDTGNPTETGVISVVHSNSNVSVQCRDILGGPDNPNFYALCLVDGYNTSVVCRDINSTLKPLAFCSAVLWHNGNGQHSLHHRGIICDDGYGIWGAGNRPGDFHVTGDFIESPAYAFVFWEPTHAENKLWVKGHSYLKGDAGGVTIGAHTQRGGKVYYQGIGKIYMQTGDAIPVFYVESAASTAKLWVECSKVTTTNNSPFMRIVSGFSDFTVQQWEDAGNPGVAKRPYNFLVEGGTNYFHGGRAAVSGPGLKATGGKTVLTGVLLDTTPTAQSTNAPAWLAGGSVVLGGCTLLSPWSAGAHSVYAASAQNVNIYNSVAQTNVHANVTVRVGPFTVDTNVQ